MVQNTVGDSPQMSESETDEECEVEKESLKIVGPSEGITNYNLTVSGKIEPHPSEGTQWSNPITTPSVEDAVGDTIHQYEFTGDIVHLHFRGNVEETSVVVDGDSLSKEDL